MPAWVSLLLLNSQICCFSTHTAQSSLPRTMLSPFHWRETKLLAQGHKMSQWHSQEQNPSLLAPSLCPVKWLGLSYKDWETVPLPAEQRVDHHDPFIASEFSHWNTIPGADLKYCEDAPDGLILCRLFLHNTEWWKTSSQCSKGSLSITNWLGSSRPSAPIKQISPLYMTMICNNSYSKQEQVC